MTRCFRRYALSLLAAVATAMAIGSPARAITLGQIDDFENGNIAGWGSNIGNTIATIVPDGGPMGAGDDALDVEASVRLLVRNDSQWTGNYTLAGVTSISMDVQHSNDFPLTLRLGFAKGGFCCQGAGDTYETAEAMVVPNDGQWHHISFDVSPAGLIPALANGPPDPPDAAAALANVTHFRLFHHPEAGQFAGESVPGTFRLDNILAEGPAVAEDADFDGDSDVDGADFLIWQRGLGVGADPMDGDADFNGAVNELDLAIWKEQFGGPTPVAAIPEPASLAIAAMAGSLIWMRRRSC